MNEWLKAYKHISLTFMVESTPFFKKKTWLIQRLVQFLLVWFIIHLFFIFLSLIHCIFSSGYLMIQNCYKVRGFLNNDLLFQNQMIKELESRVQQLTGEAENSNTQKQKLIQEKLELERCYQITCNELQEVKARYCLKSDISQVWL